MTRGLAFLLLALTGCAQQSNQVGNPTSAPSCGAHTAVIRVQDGFLEILCGCTEAAGTVSAAGSPLTCTLSSGDNVIFDYRGSRNAHQIVSSGTPSFPSSPAKVRGSAMRIHTHGFSLDTAGTYSFSDNFDQQLTGQLIVL